MGGGTARRCCDPHLAENVSTGHQASLTVAPPLPIRSGASFSLRSNSPGRGREVGREVFPGHLGTVRVQMIKAGQKSRVGPSCRWRSAGSCGDGLLQLLAANLAGARLQQQVVAGVAHQHGVVQLLVRDGQLQVAAVFAEHVTAVSVDGQGNRSREKLHFPTTVNRNV